MNYVILRDDDANALTPPALLETIYRPFLEQGMPVGLATIPEVRTDVRRADGLLEGFLFGERAGSVGTVPMADAKTLVDYLLHEPNYEIAQHGLHHDLVDGHFEFDRDDRADIARRLERGRALLVEAGFERPTTFVAPQDQVSRLSLAEIVKRFPVVSTGWYSLGRVPFSMWMRYLWAKKIRQRRHWQARGTTLLSHPGCLLSRDRSLQGMLERVIAVVEKQNLTVVVSHHWEYLVGSAPNQPLIAVLHAFADYLRTNRHVRVVRFSEALASRRSKRLTW